MRLLLQLILFVYCLEGAPLNFNYSRDLSKYIMPENITAIIPNEGLCNTALPHLLVIVPSAVVNFDKRSAIRETWGSAFKNYNYKGYNVVLAFIVGKPLNSSLKSQISVESNAYNDIIQEDFIDNYQNLTLKSVMLLKWVDRYCREAEFVVKVDDDIYLDLDNLLSLLNIHGKKMLIGGHLNCYAQPVRSKSSKWYMPYDIFPGSVYPPYALGWAYFLSGNIIHSLYKTALSTPLVHVKDVFLTGVVAKKLNISPVRFGPYTYFKKEIKACEYKSMFL
jgi:beta-1,3-galactosyltransferase 1